VGRVLYIDAAGGLAGDMLAGALLDLGWPLSELRELAGRLGLEGVRVEERRAEHRGLAARRIEVLVEADQPRRRLAEVRRCVAGLPEEVAAAASAVFQRLAEAEARVHGAAAEEVHFHEVGAADALVDVAAFCGGLAWLGWPRVVCSPLPLGRGFVRAAHGELPLPAPAVVHLLEGAPVTDWPEQVETVTPTGAALAAALADSWGGPPAMRLVASGTGGGSRSSGQRPNVVRLWLGEEEAAPAGGRVVEIVCHLDDMSPEDLTLAMERLLAAGALDAAAAPLVMKKGRLGAELVVLARPEEAEALAALALEQTTSLGVRLRPVERRVLEREVIAVDSPWGPARVKRARAGGGWRYHPEADDVAAICRRTGLPPAEVRARLARLAQEP
jgi:hypothetical protein